jgi:hypothetical protein
MIDELLSAMRDDRKSLLISEAFRSLVFVSLAAILIWVFITKKLNIIYFSGILALLILIDLWSVDRRTLNESSFVSRTDYQNQFIETAADAFILKDTDPNYRVLNFIQPQGIFNDAFTSYFHKSIGGYHGAKMRRYQDLIEGPLSSDLMQLQNILRTPSLTIEKISESFKNLNILNMLNTKYIIYSADAAPIINNAALGNAWFVKEIKWVNNADEEYLNINNFNPAQTAIIDKRFEKIFSGIESLQTDTSAKIRLISYAPDHLEYLTKCDKPQLAVFSEIYYDKGWNAYIDGKLTQHGRADYVLRTISVPQGDHKIDFKFEPRSYYLGQKVALASSLVIALLAVFVFLSYIKKNTLVKK